MKMSRQEVGKLGEKLARKFLQKRGYHIEETNLHAKTLSFAYPLS